MRKLFNPVFLFFLCLGLVLWSCEIERCEGEVPEIEINELNVIDSISAVLIINFRDCNGDVGLAAADTAPPNDYNLFLEYFYMRNGEWIKRDLANDSTNTINPFYYRVPEVENEASSDVLEGEIEVALNGYNLEAGDTLTPDTIKFEVMLRDQALNESNVIETPVIIAR